MRFQVCALLLTCRDVVVSRRVPGDRKLDSLTKRHATPARMPY